MPSSRDSEFLHRPTLSIVRTDVARIHDYLTVEQALEEIRSTAYQDRIVYFYVVNENEQLVGVIPTRKLLTAPLDETINRLMIKSLVTLSEKATLLEAYEIMSRRKLLALPVTDIKKRILGVVDIGMFTEEEFEILERERMDELFETIGFRVSQVRDASSFRAFRFRFPWLLATIVSGTICALLASLFEVTLAQSIFLAFFLTLVLGLGESVSIQSMSLTIQALRAMNPTVKWYTKAFRKELFSAILLGIACGLVVGATLVFWSGSMITALSVGGAVLMVIVTSCLIGLTIPTVLHSLNFDLRISAGPITLALADISTILIYFGLASILI